MDNIEYEKLMAELVKELEETIPENADKTELVEAFKSYAKEYLEIIEKYKLGQPEDALRFLLKRTKKLTLDQKKQKLIQDENYRKIQILSGMAYEMAANTLQGKENDVDEETKEKLKKVLKESLEKVRDFNKREAERLVSEAMLDIRFVETKKIDMVSLRLGKLIRVKK